MPAKVNIFLAHKLVLLGWIPQLFNKNLKS